MQDLSCHVLLETTHVQELSSHVIQETTFLFEPSFDDLKKIIIIITFAC